MKYTLVFFVLGLLLITVQASAQEEEPDINIEETSELFLEDYSDDFQENFFEGLKQKSIENHDKAIHLFLKCKKLDATNTVIDHELAKAYFADKQYSSAQEYGVLAVVSEPNNPWYLDTLVEILQKQGSSIDVVKSMIPFKNDKLKENLALIYFRDKDYEAAIQILKNVKKSPFSDDLTSKINDSIEKRDKKSKKTEFSTSSSTALNPLDIYKKQIKALIGENNLIDLQQVSAQALESYPAQPYFYYAQGYALTKNNRQREAVEILETGLDYIVDDPPLSNKIYTTLAEAYNALNNSIKANMYLRMIKSGL